MKNITLFLLLLLLSLLCSCAHHETSRDASKALQFKWESELGKATKAELVEDFGTPDWCRSVESAGTESCHFYRRKGTHWVGEKKVEKHPYVTFDEIFADFDSSGLLKSFKAQAQR